MVGFLADSFGSGEMLLVFLAALLLFGPKKLPELGRSLGRIMAQLTRASQDFRDQVMRIDTERDRLISDVVDQGTFGGNASPAGFAPVAKPGSGPGDGASVVSGPDAGEASGDEPALAGSGAEVEAGAGEKEGGRRCDDRELAG